MKFTKFTIMLWILINSTATAYTSVNIPSLCLMSGVMLKLLGIVRKLIQVNAPLNQNACESAAPG